MSLAIPNRAPSRIPSGRGMMFSGLMSRCTTPVSCAAAGAKATCTAISTAGADSFSHTPAMSRGVMPSMNYVAMNCPVSLRADLVNRQNVRMI